MKGFRAIPLVLCVIGYILIVSGSAEAVTIHEAAEVIANRLVEDQITTGVLAGTWPSERDFTGAIASGLIKAFEVTGDISYRNAAELSGDYITSTHGDHPYGDEAYCLARLSEVTGNAVYADTAKAFYDGLDTAGYIAGYANTDLSNAVYYIAQHTVASAMVGASEADVWRESLIQYLGQITDESAYYPVMSLGIATWALAETGSLDSSRIDEKGTFEEIWADVMLSELPEILAGQQIESGEGAGSFYYRFDHTSGQSGAEICGYTEDTVFAILGLSAAGNSGFDYTNQIMDALAVLVSPVDSDGAVYEYIETGGASYYVYGAEVLEVIPEPGSLLLLWIGSLALRVRKYR